MTTVDAQDRMKPDETPIWDGGPAFPRPVSQASAGVFQEFPQPGMSLRQWYAGMAMPFVANNLKAFAEQVPQDMKLVELISKVAFAIADEMLKE